MFSSSLELWKMNDKIFGSIEDLIAFKEDGEEQVEKKAHSLWAEDEECLPRKEIAAYIGKLWVYTNYNHKSKLVSNYLLQSIYRDPFCHRVLKSYMDQFDFTGMALDEAFR